MKCPRCNGEGSVPYHIADDMFDETLCPLCGGTGVLLTKKEQNTRDLQKAWKRFLRTQNEKEKIKKENQKAEEKD